MENGANELADCKLCRERGRPEECASEPRCAFPDGGTFSAANWNCATANALREAIGRHHDPAPGIAWMLDGDQTHVTIPLVRDGWHEEDANDPPLALWVTWYKDRGTTSAMWLLSEDGPARPPNEADARHIAAMLAGERASHVRRRR
jgi:hypothetical protein